MPLYDYVCTKCGHTMEVMHSVHGHGPSACPKCGGEMKKAFAPPAVHFKGTGWARKERSGGRTAKPKSDSTAGSDSGSKSEASSTSSAGDSPSSGPKDGD